MKLYIAHGTSSHAAQIVANELDLDIELVHYDVVGKTTSNGEDFSAINPLLYVPALQLDNDEKYVLTEAVVIGAYLADQAGATDLIPAQGTFERVKFDQLLAFMATELAQKHIPLMRKLMNEEGIAFNYRKLVAAYTLLNERFADGRRFLTGDNFTVADAYMFATWRHERSGAPIGHLRDLMDYKKRLDARPSVQKALRDDAEIFNRHVVRGGA